MQRTTSMLLLGVLLLVASSRDAAAAPADVLPTQPLDRATAKELFEQNFIGFEDWGMVDVRSGFVMRRWVEPFQGKYRRPLKGPEFYEKVGRRDLASAYRARRAGRIIAGVLGGLMIPGGLALIVWQAISNGARYHDIGGFVGGGIMVPVGFAGVFTAMFMNTQPVPSHEARELGDRYNQDLKRRLGLEPGDEPAPPNVGVTYSLAPTVTTNGGGLLLQLRF
jgi:hypothetical protein